MTNHTKEYQRDWYIKNADRIRPRKRVEMQRKRDANPGWAKGIPREWYYAMKLRQNGVCKICNRERKLDIDHDHYTGEVRGLLCRPCNVAIGNLGDNVTGLSRAFAYVEDRL